MKSQRQSCDVAVVGLGPAGAMAALGLARAGVDAVALERARFPRYKVCGGCLNARAIAILERNGIEVSTLGGQPIVRFEGAFGRRRVSFVLPEGLAISRALLDARLSEAAGAAGADVRFATKCVDAVRTDEGWCLHLESDGTERTFISRYLVVADGLAGTLRKSVDGVRTRVFPSSRVGAGTVLEWASEYAPSAIHMAVSRGGYVGLAVVEESRLNVAAAFDPGFVRDSGSPAGAAKRVLESCGWPVPVGLEDGVWKGTPPLSRRTWPVANNGAFVLGDSAGYVEPFTGEGMAWAIEGGEALAAILAHSLAQDTAGAETKWIRAYTNRLARAQRRCRWIGKGLRSPSVSATVAGVLGVVPALAGPVIADLNAVEDR